MFSPIVCSILMFFLACAVERPIPSVVESVTLSLPTISINDIGAFSWTVALSPEIISIFTSSSDWCYEVVGLDIFIVIPLCSFTESGRYSDGFADWISGVDSFLLIKFLSLIFFNDFMPSEIRIWLCFLTLSCDCLSTSFSFWHDLIELKLLKLIVWYGWTDCRPEFMWVYVPEIG